MLHVWLIPAAILLATLTFAFYVLLKYRGGSGVRSEGRTVDHKPVDEQDLPPG